jgi:hypothetical protein
MHWGESVKARVVADSHQDYIEKLIEDAEAAQLRYQSPKQFRPDRNEQPYHKPDYHSHDRAGSYSARKQLLFAGRHFNLQRHGKRYHIPRSTVTVPERSFGHGSLYHKQEHGKNGPHSRARATPKPAFREFF